MKKCKYCQSEIDDKAKVCPVCKKDVRNWFLKHPVLTVILIIFILGIVSSAANPKTPVTVTNSDTVTVNSNSTVPTTVATANIGDTIKTDKFEITVSTAEEKSKVGSEYFNKTPSEGATYVGVIFKYKNITTQPIGAYDQIPTIKLIGPNGTEYSKDFTASTYYSSEVADNSKAFSDLNPGITVKDANVFEISRTDYSTGEWKLRITADKTFEIKIK